MRNQDGGDPEASSTCVRERAAGFYVRENVVSLAPSELVVGTQPDIMCPPKFCRVEYWESEVSCRDDT